MPSATKSKPFQCQECGRLLTTTQAQRVLYGDVGCPDCGGSDIDASPLETTPWRTRKMNPAHDACSTCGADFPVHPPGYTGASGYATTRGGKRICYDCAFHEEIADAVKTGKGFFYLSGGKVTTWPGNIVSASVRKMNSWRDNFGGTRVSIRFVAPWDDNRIWSAQGPGESMYLRAKRTKFRDLWG